ncbi:hypothetical protein QOT17_019213 [Balamuthia mandrillaris]
MRRAGCCCGWVACSWLYVCWAITPGRCGPCFTRSPTSLTTPAKTAASSPLLATASTKTDALSALFFFFGRMAALHDGEKIYSLLSPEKDEAQAAALEQLGKDFPQHELNLRPTLGFHLKHYLPVEEGRKATTIRYGGSPSAIHFPLKPVLPVLISDKHNEPKGEAIIEKVCVKSFAAVTEEDAKNDGFNNKQELYEALLQFYPDLQDHHLVSIYHFHFIPHHSASSSS